MMSLMPRSSPEHSLHNAGAGSSKPGNLQDAMALFSQGSNTGLHSH